jgi:cellulose synthase/poly-beta-1,6-N-acetylglucosamine synthase-like glycosyltransferase
VAAQVSSLLEELNREGRLFDLDKARRRLRLGYPTWLILDDLVKEEVVGVLSRASGLSVLGERLTGELLDADYAGAIGIRLLKARRWVPLVNGQFAIADPFATLPDESIAGSHNLCIAPAREIDAVLGAAFPVGEARTKDVRRLGRLLVDARQISEETLAFALDEQERSGGRLGEILLAHGAVDAQTLTNFLADKLSLPILQPGEKPEPLLSAYQARIWRAVALSSSSGEITSRRAEVPVAFSDPSPAALEAIQNQLNCLVQPKLTDEETLNRLLAEVYAEQDIEDVTSSLLRHRPHFSAYRNKLSQAQLLLGVVLTLTLLSSGIAVDILFPAVVAVAVATSLYISAIIFRLYASWIGWTHESTLRPSPEDLRNLKERELPVYTVLLPVYGEKPSTLRELFRALSNLSYPRHKLAGLLLVEADDHRTQEAIEVVGKPRWLKVVDVPPEVSNASPESWYLGETTEQVSRPGWLKTLLVPPGRPRTKPRAMIYGLLYARGKLLTVYDAEDQPDPYQLKKAVWAFKHLNDESIACLQAKLNYYNPRQNLLTRWFTLEYSAWFDMFLPGLHQAKAPIPLGGTSNHFRSDVLQEALSWDPYNVTEDADLGLRLARMGKRTVTLESTTYEEANSGLKNWIRQRSRWIKGYMQTFLVHTRHPVTLYKEIGFRSSLAFLATVGGLIFTVLASPIFWAILILWILTQPGWVPELFPGLIYYMALASLFLGNFFFVFLGLIGAVGRGYDDLTPHALMMPVYWFLMSVAGYLALYELISRPSYWQKTEHGLHLQGEEAT